MVKALKISMSKPLGTRWMQELVDWEAEAAWFLVSL